MNSLFTSINAVLLFAILFLLGFSTGVKAQPNLKAGYNFSVVLPKSLNQVIETFNASQSYERSFKKVEWLHGFELGARFKADIHSFELSYQSAYQAHTAATQPLPGESSETDRLNVAVNSFAGGYQVAGDLVGAGIDLQYQHYKTRMRLTGEDEFKVNQNMWGMKFYMMFTLEGSGYIDIALQPYFVLPFDTYNTDPLSQYLNQEAGPPGKKWTRIGLSVVFYNGRK